MAQINLYENPKLAFLVTKHQIIELDWYGPVYYLDILVWNDWQVFDVLSHGHALSTQRPCIQWLIGVFFFFYLLFW